MRFNTADFCETLDGGQAFTWHACEFDKSRFAAAYEGVFGFYAARFFLDLKGETWVECLNGETDKVFLAAADAYLDGARDYEKLKAALPIAKDKVLDVSLRARPALRILRQSPQEAIIGFICSSSKRIVQIKQCVGLLSKNLGLGIGSGFHALPDFETIDRADISEVRACKLGFRADYLKKSARKIVSDKFEPANLVSMPYAEGKKYLLGLSGVGEKVADCILLFGAAKFEAFPVDTWIKKAMKDIYGLEKEDAIREFAAAHFGEHGGYAQQVIFAQKRNAKPAKKANP